MPWAELYAQEVLGQATPWEAVTSSFGVHQCGSCTERDAAALAEQQRLEAEAKRRAAAEVARREAEKRAVQQEVERQAYLARIVLVARKGDNLIFGRRNHIGRVFTCLVCKEPVTAIQIDLETVAFLHQPGKTCDARRAWIRAGMWEVLKQLERNPRAVRIYRRCNGQGCNHLFKEPLPDFDSVAGEEPSLILLQNGVPVIQLVFGSEPKLVGVAEVLELRPGKTAHRPAVWWPRKHGKFCDACTEHFTRLETAAREQREALARELESREQAEAELLRRRQEQRLEAVRSRAVSSGELHLSYLARKVAKLKQDSARVEQAACFARSYLEARGVSMAQARTFGVVVRRCEHCHGSVALLHLWNLQEVPAGLENVLTVYSNKVGPLVYNRCGHCQERLSNAHEQIEPGKAVYLLPEDLMQAETLN